MLFIVALLVVLMKGAGLIQRPYQQEWLQEKLETVTLKLDYANPFGYYKQNFNRFLLQVGSLVALTLFTFSIHDRVLNIYKEIVNYDVFLVSAVLMLGFFVAFKMKPVQRTYLTQLSGTGPNQENFTL